MRSVSKKSLIKNKRKPKLSKKIYKHNVKSVEKRKSKKNNRGKKYKPISQRGGFIARYEDDNYGGRKIIINTDSNDPVYNKYGDISIRYQKDVPNNISFNLLESIQNLIDEQQINYRNDNMTEEEKLQTFKNFLENVINRIFNEEDTEKKNVLHILEMLRNKNNNASSTVAAPGLSNENCYINQCMFPASRNLNKPHYSIVSSPVEAAGVSNKDYARLKRKFPGDQEMYNRSVVIIDMDLIFTDKMEKLCRYGEAFVPKKICIKEQINNTFLAMSEKEIQSGYFHAYAEFIDLLKLLKEAGKLVLLTSTKLRRTILKAFLALNRTTTDSILVELLRGNDYELLISDANNNARDKTTRNINLTNPDQLTQLFQERQARCCNFNFLDKYIIVDEKLQEYPDKSQTGSIYESIDAGYSTLLLELHKSLKKELAGVSLLKAFDLRRISNDVISILFITDKNIKDRDILRPEATPVSSTRRSPVSSRESPRIYENPAQYLLTIFTPYMETAQ